MLLKTSITFLPETCKFGLLNSENVLSKIINSIN